MPGPGRRVYPCDPGTHHLLCLPPPTLPDRPPGVTGCVRNRMEAECVPHPSFQSQETQDSQDVKVHHGKDTKLQPLDLETVFVF